MLGRKGGLLGSSRNEMAVCVSVRDKQVFATRSEADQQKNRDEHVVVYGTERRHMRV